MKPGVGAGYLLFDISQGVPTKTIRERWASGHYGEEGERPRGDYVKGWLRQDGRKDLKDG